MTKNPFQSVQLCGAPPVDAATPVRLHQHKPEEPRHADMWVPAGEDLAIIEWSILKDLRVELVGQANWKLLVGDYVERVAGETIGLSPFIDRLIERSEIDSGAPLEPSSVRLLVDMGRAERQRVYDRLKRNGYRAIGELKKAIEEAEAEARVGGVEFEESAAAQILKIGQECTLHLDQFREVHAKYGVKRRDGGSHYEVSLVISEEFRRHLRREYNKRHHEVAANASIDAAVRTLEALAIEECEQETVYIRRAVVGGVIYIDLGNKEREIVKVTPDGREIVADAPVLFHRPRDMAPLPRPEQGDTQEGIDHLFRLVRIKDRTSKHVILGSLHQGLGGTGENPLINIVGPPGAAKSTLAATMIRFIDPRAGGGLYWPPKTVQDLYVLAASRSVFALNNMTAIDAVMSDALCTITEGGVYGARKLFTDGEVWMTYAESLVIVTSVSPVGVEGDLVQRKVQAEMDPIAPNERLTRRDYRKRLQEVEGKIFGALLNGLSRGLRLAPTYEAKELPRLAEFGHWAACCNAAYFGAPEVFFEAEREAQAEVSHTAVEQDHALLAIVEFAKNYTEERPWKGSPTELYTAITELVEKPLRDAEKRHADISANLRLRNYGLSGYASTTEILDAGHKLQLKFGEAQVALSGARRAAKAAKGAKWPDNEVALGIKLRKSYQLLLNEGVQLVKLSRSSESSRYQIYYFFGSYINKPENAPHSTHPAFNEENQKDNGWQGDPSEKPNLQPHIPTELHARDPDYLPPRPAPRVEDAPPEAGPQPEAIEPDQAGTQPQVVTVRV
jgi:hypothetical protein